MTELALAQQIGESIVGRVEWRGAEAYCGCPGAAMHSTRNAPTDCKIVVVKSPAGVAPGIYCYHGSCSNLCLEASQRLRSQLGREIPSDGPIVHNPVPKQAAKVVFDPAKLEAVARKIPPVTKEFLSLISPRRIDNRTPASFLHDITSEGDRIVVFDVFRSQGQFVWEKTSPFNADALSEFTKGKREGVWFLNNPVNGEYTPNDNGQPSRRSWQNVLSWRYLVIESDEANPEHWLGALAQMPLRIAALTTSGGKSIHALVRVDAESKEHWDEIVSGWKPVFVTLGADVKAMSAVRLTRLPLCQRLGYTDKHGDYHSYEKPRLQELLYLNPAPSDTPLAEMSAA